VELAFTDSTLTVTTDGETLGSYPIDEVDVARVGSNRFDLRVGSDTLMFTADDAMSFSYEALPMLESAHSHRSQQALSRVRAWWRAKAEAVQRGGPPVEEVTPAGRAFTPTKDRIPLAELRRRLHVNVDVLEDEDAESSASMEPAAEVPRSMSTGDTSGGETKGESIAALTCIGVRADGKVCGSAAISERGFCFAHDPDRSIERRQAGDMTTQAAARVRRSSSDNLDDVVARLERAVAEVHEGRLDPQQAMAMASLAHAMVETIELAKSEEARKPRH
jgi:hypothetical protein